MSKEILVIEELNAVEIFKDNGIQPILDRIKAEAVAEVPDIETAEGRKRIASNAFKVAKSKTAIDALGKNLADQLNAQLKPINAERKIARNYLDNLKNEIRKPLTDWEEEEEKRAEELDNRITALDEYSNPCRLDTNDLLNSEELKNNLAALQAIDIDESFGERELEAIKAKRASIDLLNDHITKAEKYEVEQAELAQLRKEAEEREQKERDEAIAKEAADKAKADAEAKAKLEADKAEKERLDAIAREEAAKQAQAKAEREKVEAEERAKLEKEAAEKAAIEAAKQAKISARCAAEQAKQNEILRQEAEAKAEADAIAKREANKAHKGRINKGIVAAIAALDIGINEKTAKAIVIAIAKGKIDNIKINY